MQSEDNERKLKFAKREPSVNFDKYKAGTESSDEGDERQPAMRKGKEVRLSKAERNRKWRQEHREEYMASEAYDEKKRKRRDAYAKTKKIVKTRKAKKRAPPKTMAMILKENQEMKDKSAKLEAKIKENEAIIKTKDENLATIRRNAAPYLLPHLRYQYLEKRKIMYKTFLDKLIDRLYYNPLQIPGVQSLKERSAKIKGKAKREKLLTEAEHMICGFIRDEPKRKKEEEQHEDEFANAQIKLEDKYPDIDFMGNNKQV